jgi:hypothetical protein
MPTTTSSPEASPTPTSDSDIAAGCNITAAITCKDESGGACSFRNPMGDQCIGSNAQELRFIYLADSICPGNNTQNSFGCLTEEAISPNLPFTTHVRVFLGSSTVFDGVVNKGNIFDVLITENVNSIVVEISTVNTDGSPGTLLQTMMISIQCREQDGLVLMDTFGPLQLVGYRNAEQGLHTVFASVTMQYIALNSDSKDGYLTGTFKTTPFSPGMQALSDGNGILMTPGANLTLTESFTLNIAAVIGYSLEFGLLVQGADTNNGGVCGDSDQYTLFIPP